MPLWFIRELMALSLLSPLFWQLLKRPFLAVWVCITIVILMIVGIVPYRSFVYWIPVYFMGAAYSLYGVNKIDMLINYKHINKIGMLIAVGYLSFAWFLPNGINQEYMSTVQNLSYVLFRLATPVVGLIVIWWISNTDIKVRGFMHYAFFVFCMHFPMITILKIAYEKLVTQYIQSETLKYILLVSFSYALCVILAMILQRCVPKIWMVINGGRK
jgi:hypothetical protein